jgi:major membrane immunogen (membrane-anchored lipoprotein)
LSLLSSSLLSWLLLSLGAKKAVYVDGSYVSHAAADDRGNVGQITLTIAGDKTTEAKLIETGDIAMVDAVAEATGTSTLFKEAATAALGMAKNK